MSDLLKWVNPWLRDVKPYGTDHQEIFVQHPDFARMMSNENPLPPSHKVLSAIAEGAKLGNRYPHRNVDLREKIASKYGLHSENVFLANGSSEILDSMMRIFLSPGDELIIPYPVFSLYPLRCSVAGAKKVEVPFKGKNLAYDPEAYLNAITDKTKLICIVDPNNPTGSLFPEKGLKKILEKGIPVGIDEAYIHFVPRRKSKASWVKDYPHLFVYQTLSKAYGLAGVRLGYLFGQPEMVSLFERVALPWNISQMAVAAAYAALEDEEGLKERIEYNNRWMRKFCDEFKAMGLHPAKPNGNFILVDASSSGLTSQEIFDLGVQSGVVLKTIPPIDGRAGYIRITTGTEEENLRCLEFFKKTFGKQAKSGRKCKR